MKNNELMGKIEAILFAGGEPVALDRIAQVLGVRTYAVEEILAALKKKYNTRNSGIHLLVPPSSAPTRPLLSRCGRRWT